MKLMRAFFAVIFFAVIFALGLGVGFFAPRFFTGGSRHFLNTATVVQQVQTLSQLVTVKYVMEKVVVLEDVKWYGENRVLIVAHGVVKAGIDLQRLTPSDVTIFGKTILLRLPSPQITDAYLDDSQTRVIDRTTGLLRAFDKDLEQTARQNAVDDIRRAARTAGILKDADDRAREQLTNFLHQKGFEEGRVLLKNEPE